MKRITFAWIEQPAVTLCIAAVLYCVYYFVLCKLPIIGNPTFRIDYFAATITRADDNLSDSLLHARPVSELYIYLQAICAKFLLHGNTKYIIYPLQHIAVLVYFFSIAKVIESIFEVKIGIVTFCVAWILFMTNPGVLGNAYKLETIVGTLSMLFGGLALAVLAKWNNNRKISAAIIFVTLYGLSIFSKESFILPPLFLLGWYLVKDGDWKQQVASHKWLLLGIISLLLFFLIFNKFVIPTRSYMDPEKQINSPYFMTLNPFSVMKVIFYYTMGVGLHIRLLTLFYFGTLLLTLTLRIKWRENVLITMIILGMMAPYVIMPNHLFSYYGLDWWVWQTLAPLVMIQIFFKKRHSAIIVLLGLGVMAPSLKGLYEHSDINWHQSNYLRSNTTISKNITKTLFTFRNKINSYNRVAVLGIGPGGIRPSPWQGNGETEFYLGGDLGLTPQWIVFVKADGPGYVIDDKIIPESNLKTKVIVKNVSQLNDYPDIPRLIFNSDGTGGLVDPTFGSKSGAPPKFSPLFVQDVKILRSISASDNYPYMRGFNQSEEANGRWLTGDNLILLEPKPGDVFELVVYTLPTSTYRNKMAPSITISFDNCKTQPQATTPGSSRMLFPIPDSCGVAPGKPLHVRIQVNGIADPSLTHDSRELSVLGKEIGFITPPR